MIERFRFHLLRLRQQLWVRPFLMCVFSVFIVFLAKAADSVEMDIAVPFIALDTTETLLEILAASMLVIATFAVGSMVSSYASASTTATPRTFPLVLSDDVSQNALSGFIGAFIFSIVALVAVKADWYERGGHFVIFCLTLLAFAVVILIFVRWVNSIARLGRMSNTIEKVEAATRSAIAFRKSCRACSEASFGGGRPGAPRLQVFATGVGYVQRVDLERLHRLAEASDAFVKVEAAPGALIGPGRPLAVVSGSDSASLQELRQEVASHFLIGRFRTFEEDPRLGFVVLSEIAGRALSPAVNDPGTAIDVVGVLLRLLLEWSEPARPEASSEDTQDRVCLPEIETADLFHDAFTSTARDGAGTVEVGVRLQEVFAALAATRRPALREAALHHGKMALRRAELALSLPEDLERLKSAHEALRQQQKGSP